MKSLFRGTICIFLYAFLDPCYVEVGQYVSESWRHLESYDSFINVSFIVADGSSHYLWCYHCFTATRPSKWNLSGLSSVILVSATYMAYGFGCRASCRGWIQNGGLSRDLAPGLCRRALYMLYRGFSMKFIARNSMWGRRTWKELRKGTETSPGLITHWTCSKLKWGFPNWHFPSKVGYLLVKSNRIPQNNAFFV